MHDRADVVRTVVRAFRGDPARDFMIPDDYDRVAPAFAGALFDLRVNSGDAWVTEGAGSVALWVPPEGSPVDRVTAQLIWDDYHRVAGDLAWSRLRAYDAAVDDVRPSTPHWYLGVLATDPDYQGRGRARSVVTPVLELADQRAIDCCLETSKPSNKPLYAKLGFTDVSDIPFQDGPQTWWLRRPPLTETP